MGPGNTPNGDLLWDPNADDTKYYQLRMKAFISVNAAPPVSDTATVPGMSDFFRATQ